MYFKKWEPVSYIRKVMEVIALRDDDEGFRILLKADEAKTLKIQFKGAVSYRNTDEMYLHNDLKNCEGKWPLWTVQDSEYLEWYRNNQPFDEQAESSCKIIHYFILTPNDCVEILSNTEPDVEWLY
ncbi:hypothetical protein JD969_05660 [Planctomycetota bacterium]|nr:hypothetical protein JD969_05660 [Planctomycetota bacterium]